MPRRVLFIESQGSPLRGQWSAALDVDAEWLRWESLDFDTLRGSRVELVVAIAAPRCLSAERFFLRLVKTPIGKPTLAILAPERDLLGMAARAVDDFVIAPVRLDELQHRVARLLGSEIYDHEKAAAHERLTCELGLAGLVGYHPLFRRALEQIPLLARSNSPILITGETGTGKELCARAIHHLGSRRHFPFIPVDCAAFPENLFESEMFGHARGAFTDAHRDHKGLAALAGDGTLFLDEVDSLPIAAQSKLLRLLQERTYRPVGSERFVQTNVKIVAASNQDLEHLVRDKQFRSDLFFRLNVLRLHLVPLRDRRSDIDILARHFLDKLCAENGLPRRRLAPSVVQNLREYDWPGNIRELHNVIERAFIFSQGGQIQPAHLFDLSTSAQAAAAAPASFREARARAVEAFERCYIEETLRRASGNVTCAARLANKDRRVFGRLMKRYNIERCPI
jgi:DNA-binding NtrC family response regulator